MKRRRGRGYRYGSFGLFALVVVCGWSEKAGALESSFNLGYTLDYTDNARLTPASKEEEWTNVVFAEVNLLESTVSLDGHLQARTEYHDYRNDLFSDETVWNVNAMLNWHIVPQKFSWLVEDFYTQSAIDPLAPDTPTNRQDTNVFNTGPDVILRISPVHSAKFGARYTRNTYENSELDNRRSLGTVGWSYDATSRTTLSFNFAAESADFDNEILNTNFDRNDRFIQIVHRLSQNLVLLEGGATTIERKDVPDVDEGRYRFSWDRSLTATSILKLTVSSEVSDVTQRSLAVGQGATTFLPAVTGGVITSDVFRTKKYELKYEQQRATGYNTLGLYKHEDDFESTPTLEKRSGGVLILGYDYTDTFSNEVFGSYRSTENFDGLVLEEFRETTYGLRFLVNLTRSLNIVLELLRNEREGNDPQTDYVERRGLLTLTYYVGPRLLRR